MNDFAWLSNFDSKKFRTPVKIENDNEYYFSLQKNMVELIRELERCNADEYIISAIKECADNILRSIDLYYQGDLIEAQSIINQIIDELGDSAPAISNINNSIPFSYGRGANTDVQFFRARLSKNIRDYSPEEMFHIPFDKRSLVGTARFSIPGLPCLYLGNSTYDCWIELGCPADHEFNVSPVVLDNTQKVLNLTVTMSNLEYLVNPKCILNQTELEKYHGNLFKLAVLTFATSYKVDEINRTFKSEYIVPQMIMLACKKRKLDGVMYYSKRVEDEAFATVVGVNLALFATYNGESDYSSIKEHIEIGESMNYAMFKQLRQAQYKSYNLRIFSTPFVDVIGKYERQYPYRETMFCVFDQYLFATWKRKSLINVGK